MHFGSNEDLKCFRIRIRGGGGSVKLKASANYKGRKTPSDKQGQSQREECFHYQISGCPSSLSESSTTPVRAVFKSFRSIVLKSIPRASRIDSHLSATAANSPGDGGMRFVRQIHSQMFPRARSALIDEVGLKEHCYTLACMIRAVTEQMPCDPS